MIRDRCFSRCLLAIAFVTAIGCATTGMHPDAGGAAKRAVHETPATASSAAAGPPASIDEVARACSSHFTTPGLEHWYVTVDCADDGDATIKATVVRMEHDLDGNIASSLVEDLYIAPAKIDTTKLAVQDGPGPVWWVVVVAKTGHTLRRVYWKKNERFEEQTGVVKLPFATEQRARAFVDTMVRAAA